MNIKIILGLVIGAAALITALWPKDDLDVEPEPEPGKNKTPGALKAQKERLLKKHEAALDILTKSTGLDLEKKKAENEKLKTKIENLKLQIEGLKPPGDEPE